MSNTVKSVVIVEYAEKYAKSVSEMWNRSSSGWNGRVFKETEESVKETEKGSKHLKLFLAVLEESLNTDKPLVLGYCKVSKYFFDDETLYINLLNVDPTYHGAKIGKQLVLKAVAFTIDYGYPRLDLFTWPGNTKAVPLYKKCGFFWENSETGSTHLMNFIPQVFSQPLLKKLLSDTDWYADSTREIVVEPDGEELNGTSYFKYNWLSNDKKIQCTFEKNARGLCAVETDDYKIELHQTELKRVFSEEYPFEILFTPKNTTLSYDLDINGEKHKTVETSMQFQGQVKEPCQIKGTFFVHPIEADQDDWSTHPSVMVRVKINGEMVVLKSGVKPLKPLTIEFVNEEKIVRKNKTCIMRLNLESHLKKAANFKIDLSAFSQLGFKEKEVKIHLEPGETECIKLAYEAKKSYASYEPVKVTIDSETSTVTYVQNTGIYLQVFGTAGFGGDHQYDMLMQDTCLVKMDKHFEFNEISFSNLVTGSFCFISQPKFGEPFSSEFDRKKYTSVSYESKENLIMTHLYDSDDFEGAKINRNVALEPNGTLHIWYECLGLPSEGSVKVALPLYFNSESAYMPLDQSVIKLDHSSMDNFDFASYDLSKLDEPWIFGETRGGSLSVHWDRADTMRYSNHALEWQYTFTKVGEKTNPITLHLDTFKTPHQLRRYLFDQAISKRQEVEAVRIQVNNGNPFVDQSNLEIKTQHYLTNNSIAEQEFFSVELENEFYETPLNETLECSLNASIAVASGFINKKAKRMPFRNVVFKSINQSCSYSIVETFGKRVHLIDNGVIQIKACPEFSAGIYDIVYKEKSMLGHSFPEPIAKSWFNPWSGGYFGVFSGVSLIQLQEAEKSAKKVEVYDNYGNLWTGLSVEINYDFHSKFKGIHTVNYYLTRPGIPVVAHFTKVLSKTKKFSNKQFQTTIFFSNETKNIAFEHKQKVYTNQRSDEAIEHSIETKHMKNQVSDSVYIHQFCQNETVIFPCVDKELIYTEVYERLFIDSEKPAISKVDILVVDEGVLQLGDLQSLNDLTFEV